MGGKSQSPNTPNIVHFLRQHVIKRADQLCNFLWVSLVDSVPPNGSLISDWMNKVFLYSNQFLVKLTRPN